MEPTATPPRYGRWMVVVVMVVVLGKTVATSLITAPLEVPEVMAIPAGPHQKSEPYSLSWVREGRQAAVPIQFSESSDAGSLILNQVTNYGINATNYLTNVKEPQLFQEGYHLQQGDPGLFLAAFNKQKKRSKDLASFGYASLKASELLSKQFLLTRQQALFGLEQVSLRNTALYDDCPVKTDQLTELDCPAYSAMFRTLDGTCNNLENPGWGAAFRPFARFLPPDYSDGIDKLRESVWEGELPNPRRISDTVHRALNSPSYKITMMVMQWGQFLDHDLTATAQTRGFNHSVPKCCNEKDGVPLPEMFRHPDCLPISIPKTDVFYSQWNHTCMEFVRSSPAPRPNCALGPRDQINQVTSFLDGSNVYGSDDQEMAQLRLWEDGMLKYKPVRFRKPLLPPLHHFQEGECRENSRNLHCFLAGDVRVNEQPALTSMHTVWLREHNRLVGLLAEINPHWSDDRLFFQARKIVGAQMQKITYGEWLPVVLGPAVMKVFRLPLQRYGYYRGYRPSTNPTATNAFATAAFRFGHSLVQHTLMRCDKTGRRVPFSIKLHEELMNPANIHNFGSVDRLMLGLAFEMAQARDVYMTNELTRHLFQTPGHHYGMDLASLNIQRGRDHGLPAYNIWREQCGLHRFTNWGELLQVMDDDTVGRLAAVYRHVDDIDLFPGGLAEKPVIRGLVGPTFACILGQQFLNLRRGDRFWFENGGQVSSLTPEQLREVRKVTLARVLCNNLDDVDELQPNLFRPVTENGRNTKQSCHGPGIPSLDLRPWKEDFPSLVYSVTADLNFSQVTSQSTSSSDEVGESGAAGESEDLSGLSEEELFYLEDEDVYGDYDDNRLQDIFSQELPRPFEEPDEKSGKGGQEGENDASMGSSAASYAGHSPSMSQFTQQNFDNVIQQAYSNTLFYGRSRGRQLNTNP
ncbi:salivary peroxidase/catechol oxidase-like isoform X3 [Cherax quadricarinatus]|uniref:salivary peroxidase/catechol oxidase-like isoform X3 n=1 Tax=Cherax quadricarinatus TaxID=27406 RepID=UPI002379CC1D|nr:peroxidase-like isoform X2 [Cherax quadricarinatus]